MNILFPSPQRIYYWGVVKISEKYLAWKYQLWNNFMTNLNYWVGVDSAIQSITRILLKCMHVLFSLSHSDTHTHTLTHTHTHFIFLSFETYFSISLFFQYKYEINTSLPINLVIHCFISPTKHFTSIFFTMLYEFFFKLIYFNWRLIIIL